MSKKHLRLVLLRSDYFMALNGRLIDTEWHKYVDHLRHRGGGIEAPSLINHSGKFYKDIC